MLLLDFDIPFRMNLQLTIFAFNEQRHTPPVLILNLLFSAELKPRCYYLEHVFYLDHVIFTNMSHVYYLDQ